MVVMVLIMYKQNETVRLYRAIPKEQVLGPVSHLLVCLIRPFIRVEDLGFLFDSSPSTVLGTSFPGLGP